MFQNNPLLKLAQKITKETDNYTKEFHNYQQMIVEKVEESTMPEDALLNVIRKQENEIKQLKRKIEAKRASAVEKPSA